MKALKLLFTTILVVTITLSCKKENNNQQIIPIPNGDFELWDNQPTLNTWLTNSCPPCVPPFDTYVIKKVTDASNGQFAAKFIFNNVYTSYAINKFQISLHPSVLTGYIKSNIASGDTATIHINLFSGNNIIDIGNFSETTSNGSYRQIEIPISQNSQSIDSASIEITGGKKLGTELHIDNLVFIKNE